MGVYVDLSAWAWPRRMLLLLASGRGIREGGGGGAFVLGILFVCKEYVDEIVIYTYMMFSFS